LDWLINFSVIYSKIILVFKTVDMITADAAELCLHLHVIS